MNTDATKPSHDAANATMLLTYVIIIAGIVAGAVWVASTDRSTREEVLTWGADGPMEWAEG